MNRQIPKTDSEWLSDTRGEVYTRLTRYEDELEINRAADTQSAQAWAIVYLADVLRLAMLTEDL